MFSLRYFLLIPFLVLIGLSVFATGFLTWQYGQRETINLSQQLTQLENKRIQAEVSRFLDSPKHYNAEIKRSLQQGLLSPKQPTLLSNYMLNMVKADQNISTLQLGTPQKTYLGAGWAADNQLVLKSADNASEYRFITRSAQFPEHIISSRADYNVTERPWYTAALAVNKPVWSPVYEMFSHQKLGITLSEAVYDAENNLVGVVGSDILLDELTDQLARAQTTEGALLFIVDGKDNLLAINHAAHDASQQKSLKRTSQLMSMTEYANKYDDQLLKHAISVLNKTKSRDLPFADTQTFNVSGQDERYYFNFTPLSGQYGLDWQLVIAAPEADFLASLKTVKHYTLALLLGSLLLAILLSVMISRNAANAMQRLVAQVSSIKDDGSGYVSQNYMSQEFRSLNAAFGEMAARLKASFASIKYSKEQLEETVAERTHQLQLANTELELIASTDKLTQLANRRKFDEFIKSSWMQAQKRHSTMALIMCDIDHFKEYNDTYGHQVGDACIHKVAKVLLDAIRDRDIAARYGGDEFAIVMPGAKLENAERVAKTVLSEINDLRIDHVTSRVAGHVTMSIGVACISGSDHNDVNVLVAQADAALYVAKTSGRNRYEIAPDM